MSTHQLDASGQRTLTTTVNDPARTAATVNAKQGDDAVLMLGGFQRIEVPLYDGLEAKVVRRISTEKVAKRNEQGEHVRDKDSHLVYEDKQIERRILVFETSNLQLSAHTDKEREFPGTPHTTFRVVNLENDPYPPVWTKGENVDEGELVL